MTLARKVVKKTLNGQYGNAMRKKTPLNYLRRLAVLTRYAPVLDIRVLGIMPGMAAAHRIITEMAFIEGTRPRQSSFNAKLRKEGWALDLGDMHNWKHEGMGLRMLSPMSMFSSAPALGLVVQKNLASP